MNERCYDCFGASFNDCEQCPLLRGKFRRKKWMLGTVVYSNSPIESCKDRVLDSDNNDYECEHPGATTITII